MATYNPMSYYQPQSIGIPQSPMTWVQGPQQVDTFPVQYGGTVVLWDKEQPIIYIKSVDNFGNTNVQILDYTFRKNQASTVQETQTNEDEKNYVTKEDFNKFTEDLQKQLNEIMSSCSKNSQEIKINRKFKED